MNLAEALRDEIKRNERLLSMYKEIPTGAFGCIVIQTALDAAHDAIAKDDVVEMLRCYQSLKSNK